jgi:hypothetical protein
MIPNVNQISGRLCMIVCTLAVGCARSEPRPQYQHIAPDGDRSDFKTALGPHDGYELQKCVNTARCFIVQGQGPHWFHGTADDSTDRPGQLHPEPPEVKPFLQEIADKLKDMPIWMAGYSLRCNRVGLELSLSDWRRLDEAIAGVAAVLAHDGLREPVFICVGANNFHYL